MTKKRFNRNLSLIFCLASQFFNCVAISVPSPFLPRETELHGLSSLTTGIMLGIVDFENCLFSFMWNKIAVRIGMRNVLKIGNLITSLSTALFASVHFIPHAQSTTFVMAGLAIRFLLGIGSSACWTSSLTIAGSLFLEESVWVLSILAALGGVGMVSGPAIGSALFTVGGFWLVFVVCGGVMCVSCITMFIWLPNSDKGNDAISKKDQSQDVPYGKILCNPRTLIGLIVGMFSASCWTCIDPILEPQLRTEYGLTEDKTALVFLLLSGTFFVSSPIVGRFVGKPYCMDSIFVVIIGLGIAVGSFLLAGPCPLFKIEKLELWMLLVCLSILGLTNSLIYVPAQDLTFNISNLELPENVDRTLVRGFLSSCWVTFYSFGFGIGMVFSGSVAQYTGWAWTMTSYAGGCVLFIVIVSIVKVREILLLGVCKPKYETLNSS